MPIPAAMAENVAMRDIDNARAFKSDMLDKITFKIRRAFLSDGFAMRGGVYSMLARRFLIAARSARGFFFTFLQRAASKKHGDGAQNTGALMTMRERAAIHFPADA